MATAPILTRREAVVESVRRSIILGECAPGQRLPEVSLAAELGVSRPTVREALIRLTHEGLCVQEPHRGFSVAHLDAGAIRDLTQTRVTLDLLAAHSISGNNARVQALQDEWAIYLAAATDPDPLAQHLAHVAFHRGLWAASGNDTLRRLWPTLESLSTLVLAQDQAMRANPGRATAMHGRIVDAITAGDAVGIEAAFDAHTRQSAEEFIVSQGQ